MQKRETGSAKWIERRSGVTKKNLNAGFYMRRDGSTLFESPLTQTINSSPSIAGSVNGVHEEHSGALDEEDSGEVSLNRTPIDDARRGPDFADRVQRIVAGRVGRSASDTRLSAAAGSSEAIASNSTTASNNKKLPTSRTMPNGFSMAYRPATIAENTAFEGIREDDL